MNKNIPKEKNIEYITDLNYGNYLDKKDMIIDSVNTIMEILDLNIVNLHKLVRLHEHTLRRVLRRQIIGRLRTYSKLNNFVLNVLTLDKEHKLFKKIHKDDNV